MLVKQWLDALSSLFNDYEELYPFKRGEEDLEAYAVLQAEYLRCVAQNPDGDAEISTELQQICNVYIDRINWVSKPKIKE